MSNKELLAEAKNIFYGDKYADVGYSKVALKLDERHMNAVGQVMGGVYFTIADYAFAIASNFKQNPTVTQTSQIAFLAPVKGDTIFAEAMKIRSGRTTCFYKIIITDSTGEQIAYVTTTGFILNN